MSGSQVWTWLIRGFIPLIAGSHEEPGVVRKFNQVIRPGIQLRQRRVSGGDCPVVEELQEYFRAECRTSERLPSRFGPEATNRKTFGKTFGLHFSSFLFISQVNNTGTDRSFVAGGGIEVDRWLSVHCGQVATMAFNDPAEAVNFKSSN